MQGPLRLLIVDDSALMRRVLREMFESDPAISVVGEAANGREALQQAEELRPQVITMDVWMPVMDGLTTTEQLMAYQPTPILVLTASLSRKDVDITFKMLGAGALDVMEKPAINDAAALERARRELIRKVKLLSRVRVVTHLRGRRQSKLQHVGLERLRAAQPVAAGRAVVRQPAEVASALPAAFPIVVIGASTGGPRVVRQILAGLPATYAAAVLVVQHIAEGFSAGMVEWLTDGTMLPVALAAESAPLGPGKVFVAPDRFNMLIEPDGRIHLSDKPLLLQSPAIDVTMQAAAEVFGRKTIGVLLTGMGRDGAIGMLSIRRAGGYTLAQSEATCTIYGMPRAAVEIGAADVVLPPEGIIEALIRRVAK